MMLVKSEGLYILYNDEGYCLGNGDYSSLPRIFEKWAKKANGSRVRFNALVEGFRPKSCKFRFSNHVESIKELWEEQSYSMKLVLDDLVSEALNSCVPVLKHPRLVSLPQPKISEEKGAEKVKILRTKIKIRRR